MREVNRTPTSIANFILKEGARQQRRKRRRAPSGWRRPASLVTPPEPEAAADPRPQDEPSAPEESAGGVTGPTSFSVGVPTYAPQPEIVSRLPAKGPGEP